MMFNNNLSKLQHLLPSVDIILQDEMFKYSSLKTHESTGAEAEHVSSLH